MKFKKTILNLSIMAFPTVALLSCTLGESRNGVEKPMPGIMDIEVVAEGEDEDDRIFQARFIIFDNASEYPVLDINEVVILDEKDRNAKEFRTTLRVTQNDDKMILVILNEPNSLTGILDRISHPSQAENILFSMLDSFDEYLNAPSATGMPMSGVKRGVSVTEETASPVSISVERAVARVELWLKTESGVTAQITNNTQVSLRKNHGEGYLVTGTLTDGTRFQTGAGEKNNFGRMLDINRPEGNVNWVYEEWEPMLLTRQFKKVVVFYTPERMCDLADDSNKLIIDIYNIHTSEGLRDGHVVLREFTAEGGLQTEIIKDIRRNSIYRIYGNITAKTIEFSRMVAPWEREDVDLEVED